MYASTACNAKRVDFSCIKSKTDNGMQPHDRMHGVILWFVHGIRGNRSSNVTLRQIHKWFSATPREFVSAEVDRLVDKGYLKIGRSSFNRKRFVYTYGITNMGDASMRGHTVWDTPRGREYADYRDE